MMILDQSLSDALADDGAEGPRTIDDRTSEVDKKLSGCSPRHPWMPGTRHHKAGHD
jgi:hypothetical protein